MKARGRFVIGAAAVALVVLGSVWKVRSGRATPALPLGTVGQPAVVALIDDDVTALDVSADGELAAAAWTLRSDPTLVGVAVSLNSGQDPWSRMTIRTANARENSVRVITRLTTTPRRWWPGTRRDREVIVSADGAASGEAWHSENGRPFAPIRWTPSDNWTIAATREPTRAHVVPAAMARGLGERVLDAPASDAQLGWFGQDTPQSLLGLWTRRSSSSLFLARYPLVAGERHQTAGFDLPITVANDLAPGEPVAAAGADIGAVIVYVQRGERPAIVARNVAYDRACGAVSTPAIVGAKQETFF